MENKIEKRKSYSQQLLEEGGLIEIGSESACFEQFLNEQKSPLSYNCDEQLFDIQNEDRPNVRLSRTTQFLREIDNSKNPQKYLNAVDAAQFLRRTRKAVYELVHKNQITVVRPQGKRKLLFRRMDLERFIESSEGVFL